MDFLDTNVLIYAYDEDDADKREVAQRLIREGILQETTMLSAQVLGEFYVTATRKFANPMSSDEAERVLEQLERMPVVGIDAALARRARETSARYQISYWDGLIVAAAERGGCGRILTEDLSDGQTYSGVHVVHPFTEKE